jgi:hypothetical protein
MLFNRGGLSPRRDQVDLVGRLNLGATGAITTQTKKKYSGFVAARTGAGVYTITLDKTAARYAELLAFQATIIGANATYTATAGRDYYISSDLTATTGVITVKFLQVSGAVAEIEDNAIVLLQLAMSTSAATVG